MTSIKFYGGVDEIGGNRILVEDKDTKIFLGFWDELFKAWNVFRRVSETEVFVCRIEGSSGIKIAAFYGWNLQGRSFASHRKKTPQ